MEILAIIPARGGSKSIPHKNIALVAGRPLLEYTCDAALRSKKLTRIVLDTDDPIIAEVGKHCGVEAPYLRPSELSRDDTPMLPVLKHALEYFDHNEKYHPEIVVLLQPTSPLRAAHHIDAVIELLLKSPDADSAVSIVEVPHHYNPVSVLHFEHGRVLPYLEGNSLLRRQDKPKVYARNGPAVLAMRRATIIEKQSLYGETTLGFLMKPEESIDIDTPFDFEIAEFLLTRRK